MVKNNHFSDNRSQLNDLLLGVETASTRSHLSRILEYARFMAAIENVVVVVSDMADCKSHIIAGGFARSLGLDGYSHENSIWESRILSLMSPEEQEQKYIAELRFFHHLRHIPNHKKSDYYLLSKLRFRYPDGTIHDVLHRMYYVYDEKCENVRFALCIYGSLTFEFKGKSFVVNSITGMREELTSSGNDSVLSRRERQVLTLIYTGMKSAEIADSLHISINTVNRHRQEIIGKLQVKNSHEACRLAKAMDLI